MIEYFTHSRLFETLIGGFCGEELVEIRIHRPHQHPKIGETYCAIIREIDARFGAFADIGSKRVFLDLNKKANLKIGQKILLQIVRSEIENKLASAILLGPAKENQPCPSIISCPNLPQKVANVSQVEQMLAAIENAKSQEFAISNLGTLTIQQTKALLSIDVNGDSKFQNSNKKSFEEKLNRAAAKEIARLIKLYDLSGLICIDFAGSPNGQTAKEIFETIKGEFSKEKVQNPKAPKTEILPISHFGLMQIAKKKTQNSILQISADNESQAIFALNEFAQKIQNSIGKKIVLKLNPLVFNMLETLQPNISDFFAQKIGGIFEILPDEKCKIYEIHEVGSD